MATRFEFDPDFDDNVYRASNKSRSSLRGLYDKVRSVTDEIAKDAKGSIEREYALAEGAVATAKDGNIFNTEKNDFLVSKARAFALRSAANATVPIMGYDGKEIYGRVLINRRGSMTLEFGGADPVAEIGKGSGAYIEHPGYAFLRRSMDRIGS